MSDVGLSNGQDSSLKVNLPAPCMLATALLDLCEPLHPTGPRPGGPRAAHGWAQGAGGSSPRCLGSSWCEEPLNRVLWRTFPSGATRAWASPQLPHSRGQGQLVSDRGHGAVAISVWWLMGGDNLGGLRTKNVHVPLPLTVRRPCDHFLVTDTRSGKLPAHVPLS